MLTSLSKTDSFVNYDPIICTLDAPIVDVDLYAGHILQDSRDEAASTSPRSRCRALLRAMVEPVQTIEVGTPTRLRNNTLEGIAQLPAPDSAQ
jgi:hypothetical protein